MYAGYTLVGGSPLDRSTGALLNFHLCEAFRAVSFDTVEVELWYVIWLHRVIITGLCSSKKLPVLGLLKIAFGGSCFLFHWVWS